MRYFFGLLFLPGVLCLENPLEINPIDLNAWVGSCVVIPCNIKEGRPKVDINSFIWYSQPHYDNDLQEFVGTILYNSSSNSENYTSTQNSLFKDRVKFVGDLKKRNCSLKISQLQRTDTGVFMPRLYGFDKNLKKELKWKLDVQVNVIELPPAPEMKITPQQAVEYKEFKVTCSVPYQCPDEPLRLTLTGLDKRNSQLEEAKEIGKIQTALTFRPTWNDHGKTLRCSLRHQNGSVISESMLWLNVNYAPKELALIPTPRRIVQAGGSVSLECTTNSNPPAAYKWYKNDIWRREWRGSKIEFNPVEEHDAGTYRCEVRNTIGSSKKELTLEVQYLPKEPIVYVAPWDIKEGLTVDLTCSSSGNPPVSRYEWFKGTHLVHFNEMKSSPFQNNGILHFERIQPSDSGTYYCVAKNQLGNSSSTPVTLDVRYPPKNVQLVNQSPLTVEEGDTVTLNCSTGRSNPPVSWYGWSDNARDKSKQRNLLIFQASERDSGSFYCEACNSVGCTQSTPTLVDVLFGPKDVKVVQEPRSQIHEGNRVQMNCQVGRANPMQLTYEWYKDDQLQLDSAGVTQTISKVTSADSGVYFCEAKNSVGKSRSSVATLDILYGPRNVNVSLNTSEAVTEGTDVKLLCNSDANPVAAYYEWSWNEEWNSLEHSRILTLAKVQVNQSGAYRCRAKNRVSTGESGPLYLEVSFSSATVLKRTLVGLGIALSLLMFIGFLVFILRNCKKQIDPSTGQTRRASFFVKKAKGGNLCPNNRSSEGSTDHSLGFLNQRVEDDISYATIRFPPSSSKDRTEYACIKGPNLAMVSADDTVIYSAVKKPRLPEKGDAKHDYENVENKSEEEVHYSTLINLAPKPCITYRDSDTDSDMEDSIQYASLKH